MECPGTYLNDFVLNLSCDVIPTIRGKLAASNPSPGRRPYIYIPRSAFHTKKATKRRHSLRPLSAIRKSQIPLDHNSTILTLERFQIMAAKRLRVGLWVHLLMVTVFAQEHNSTNFDNVTLSDDNSTIGVTETGNYTETEYWIVTKTTVISLDTPAEEISPCTNDPCHNGGTCSYLPENSFKCSCPERYSGETCEIADQCYRDENEEPCSNGICVEDQSRKVRFCKCFPGTFWDSAISRCREPEEPCFPNPCQYNGTCEAISNEEYYCHCQEGRSGRNCDVMDDCVKSENGVECENGRCYFDEEHKKKFCDCYGSFALDATTKTCIKVTLPCIPNPCKNDGECAPASKEQFNCTCKSGYAGENCEIIDLCVHDSDGVICKNGICTLDERNDQKCVCSEGYYRNETTWSCKKKSPPCSPNPCQNKGVCQSITDKEYNCTCIPGFEGKHCNEEDKCILEGGKAFCRDAQCVMDYAKLIYSCQCPEGQHFDYSRRECKDIDFCPLITCKKNEVCENSTCKCRENFKRNNQSDLCEPKFCLVKKCPADGMTCEENTGGNPENIKCACPENYSFNGTDCNFVGCSIPALHHCQQFCEEVKGGFACKCEDSFRLKPDNRSCEYLGNETCVNMTCKAGFCVSKGKAEQCLCPAGFAKQDSQTCIDLCSAKKLPPGICPSDKCESTENEFRCVCKGRYKMDENKVTCAERNMCDENENGWKKCQEKNAICITDQNGTDGFKCMCSSGFEMSKKRICERSCDIEENIRKCSILGGTCDLDLNYKQTCRCPPTFQYFGKKKSCKERAKNTYLVNLPVAAEHYHENKKFTLRSIQRSAKENIDYYRLWKDVTQSMKQLLPVFEFANILACRTKNDMLLCTIELQFQEWASEGVDLQRIKMSIHCPSNATLSQEKCFIPPSLVLLRDKIESIVSFNETDSCHEVVKSNLCDPYTECSSSAERKSFSCTCKPGFKAYRRLYMHTNVDSFTEMCQDTDECSEGNVCPVSTICSNTIGSYECFCAPGYRVINDSSDPKDEDCVRLCNPNPCAHGFCNPIGDHNFECTCDAGFTGALCNSEDRHYKDAKVNTIIVGAVLGGVLLVVIIVFISKVSRKRSMKFDEEPSQFLYSSTEMTERRTVVTGITNNAYQREEN